MLFSYDKDIRNIYFEAIKKLETVSKIGLVELFSGLRYPKHWQKYSNPIKFSIFNDVTQRLVDNDIVTMTYSGNDKCFLYSKIHDLNVCHESPKLR